MRSSAKHLLAMLLLALLGFLVALAPFWVPSLGLDSWVSLVGVALSLVAIVSRWGIGPWGRRYKQLYIAEHHAEIGRPQSGRDAGV